MILIDKWAKITQLISEQESFHRKQKQKHTPTQTISHVFNLEIDF